MTYWTEADQAELEVLLWALVDSHAEHRTLCPTCVRAIEPCPAVQRAIAEVLDWRQARILLSRAEALRADQLEGAA